jgi:hypothetical protein
VSDLTAKQRKDVQKIKTIDQFFKKKPIQNDKKL